MGTKIFQNVLSLSGADYKHLGILKEVWQSTPWIVHAYTGSSDDDHYKEVKNWCLEQFGVEACPLRGLAGNWQTGNVTFMGWTWIGFSTEEQMNKFILRWLTSEIISASESSDHGNNF